MSLPVNSSAQSGDSWLALANKVTALNPNAAEFVPLSLRSDFGGSKALDATKKDAHSFPLKTILDRSESSKSNNSDDEAHQFWHKQLPDDIIPDFTTIMKDEQESGQLSLTGLSLNDNVATSPLGTTNSSLFMVHQDLLSQASEGQASSRYQDDSQASLLYGPSIWEQKFISNAHSTSETDDHHYARDTTAGFGDISPFDYAGVDDGAVNPLAYLVSQFPNFSAESLADLYYANGCNFNTTMEILTELEMQADGSSHQNLSLSSAAPSFSMVDFPTLPTSEDQNGLLKDNADLASMNGRKASVIGSGATDFVSAVRRLSAHSNGQWKFDKKSSQPASGGVSGVLSRQYNAPLRSPAFANSLHSSGTARAAPVWLETGEAVANMYAESREEARDLARVRNTCFEQARQAYLVGHKALAKELSAKGQMYNMQMKAAHEKAKEAIYRQRNSATGAVGLQGYGQKPDQMIDLHGLHVSEALQILKHELATLKNAARSMGERMAVMICVGTGHHTKLRTARLPIAVEQFLLDAGLHFTQPQPGLLRVVLY